MEKTIANKGMTYAAYDELLKDMAARGLSTGEKPTESQIAYTKLNFQRSKRVTKTIQLNEELKKVLLGLKEKQTWAVLTETWCGDSAQNLPLIHKMAAATQAIELVVFLRDENLEVMDQYLTNGARSIPKLIARSKEHQQTLFTWGPSPAPLYEMKMKNKVAPEVSKEEFAIQQQQWYNDDKGQTMQKEFLKLLRPFSSIS